MILFHNTECGNNNNINQLFSLFPLSLFPLDCIGLAYGAVTWWTNDSEKPKVSKQVPVKNL